MTKDQYRAMRLRLGSQPEAATALGVSLQAISRRERGVHEITREIEYALRFAVELSRGMKSRKPIKRANPKRKAEAFERAYGGKERLAFVQSLECAVTGCKSVRIEAAHSVNGGMGRKGDASTTLPLCHDHHHEQHKVGIRTFEGRHGINLRDEAAKTDEQWRDYLKATP